MVPPLLFALRRLRSEPRSGLPTVAALPLNPHPLDVQVSGDELQLLLGLQGAGFERGT